MENKKENNEKNLSQHSLRMMRKAFVFKQQVKKIFFQDSFGLGKKFWNECKKQFEWSMMVFVFPPSVGWLAGSRLPF